MKYKVTLAAIVMVAPALAQRLGFIPHTDQDMELDTRGGLGREIWWGYLRMRGEQRAEVPPEGAWYKIRVPEDDSLVNEIHKFTEAINLFFRYLAEGSRDNCLAVKKIEPVT